MITPCRHFLDDLDVALADRSGGCQDQEYLFLVEITGGQ